MPILTLQRHVPLRELTTLGVGGPTESLAHCGNPAGLRRALEIAHDEGLETVVLGGGSNVIVSDRGFAGMVIQYTADRLEADLGTGRVRVDAGYDWDRLVDWCVAHDLTGLECLSGIPGWAGAAPIQNIGAYGQEVGPRIRAVHVVRRADGHELRLEGDDCGFAYRDSHFKGIWRDVYCVTGLELQLERGGAPVIAYEELATRLAEAAATAPGPATAAVREVVLAIRRGKSMVLDPDDPNRRSAGSFFTNPIVPVAFADSIAAAQPEPARMPRWDAGPGQVKLAAAWLIQQAGFAKGQVRGGAGLSSRHVLALINREDATAAELLAFAREIRDRVLDRFGVRLRPEPVPLGFEPGEIADLW